MPGSTSTSTYTFAAIDGGTWAIDESTFASLAGLRTVLEMGVVEGATGAINQLDGLLTRD